MGGRRGDTWVIKELGIDTEQCPAQMVTADSWELLDLYQHYRAGFLPYAGGLMAQPQAFLDAMQIISGEINSE